MSDSRINIWGIVMELKCPYCKSNLIEGYIDGGRYGLRWFNKDMNFIESFLVFVGNYYVIALESNVIDVKTVIKSNENIQYRIH